MGRSRNNNSAYQSKVIIIRPQIFNNINNKKKNEINPFKIIYRELIHYLLIYEVNFTPHYEILVLKQNPGFGNLFIGILMLLFSYKPLFGISPYNNKNNNSNFNSELDLTTCNSVANTFLINNIKQQHHQQDYFRISSLFIASFIHDNFYGLYVTFIAFLWFGKPLEKLLGTIRFILFIFVIVIGENIMVLIWNIILAELFSNNDDDKEIYYTQCMNGLYGVVYVLWIINCAAFPDNLTKMYYFKSIRTKINSPFYFPFIHILLEMWVLELVMELSWLDEEDAFIYYANWPAVIFGLVFVYIVRFTGNYLGNLLAFNYNT